MFKIVADQGSNVKKAFKETKSSDSHFKNVVHDICDQIQVDCNEIEEDKSDKTDSTDFDFNLSSSVLTDADQDDTISDSSNFIIETDQSNWIRLEDEKAYQICANHNLQLTINDSFKAVRFKTLTSARIMT